MFACLSRPSAGDGSALVAIARDFSPRYEQHRADLVSIDVSGLERLIGPPRTIGEELRREIARRGIDAHVAVAGTRSAALVIALACPGLTVVDPGGERERLAVLPIAVLDKIPSAPISIEAIAVLKRWGLRTLGELAALSPAELASRVGPQAIVWQTVARGEDIAPLVPTLPDERFEAAIDLEWPIEDLEPLSFVLTRLLEPLSIRLERRDRGAAGVRLDLRLVGGDVYTRRLQLPSPIREARTLRTLIALDLESHPPPAGIERVTIAIDPTPGRIVQHTFFTRAHPTPEQLSTLLARLGALMGQDRVGAAAMVDSYRPGAFAMEAFPTEHDHVQRGTRRTRREGEVNNSAIFAGSALNVVSALRRCRQPVPARAVIEHGRPVRLTTDRRGFAGGRVLACAGPWRTSGNWWVDQTSDFRLQRCLFDRDEWDITLDDRGVYRVFRDRETDGWFVDGIFD